MVGEFSDDPEISTMMIVPNNITNTRIDLGPKWQGNKCVGVRSDRTKGITWITWIMGGILEETTKSRTIQKMATPGLHSIKESSGLSMLLITMLFPQWEIDDSQQPECPIALSLSETHGCLETDAQLSLGSNPHYREASEQLCSSTSGQEFLHPR